MSEKADPKFVNTILYHQYDPKDKVYVAYSILILGRKSEKDTWEYGTFCVRVAHDSVNEAIDGVNTATRRRFVDGFDDSFFEYDTYPEISFIEDYPFVNINMEK